MAGHALVIENGTLYTAIGVVSDAMVLVKGTRIAQIGRRGEIGVPQRAQRLDAGGGAIVPGFVNMHIHGVGGYGSMDAQVSSLKAMSKLLPRHGVTSWVPTTGSAPLDAITSALETVREAMNAQRNLNGGAEILGAHVEGPYLNAQERGAHPIDLLLVPRPEQYATLLQYADVIRVFTLAPELPGSLELIKELKELDILVSAGHSIAIDQELALAVDAGLSHATHMFCNMGTLRRVDLRRVAGLVESVLLDDRVTTEIIADGYHIAPSLMSLALKAKGTGKLAIVTDSSPLTGLPPGSYSAFGQDVILETEISYVADRSAFAGSVATMDQCLRGAIDHMSVSLADAVRMASLTPASLLGVANRKGSIEAGKDADITILNDGLRVTHTVIGGRVFNVGTDSRLENGGEFGWRVAL